MAKDQRYSRERNLRRLQIYDKMKILIETFRLIRKMGLYQAWSTMEVVALTDKKRSSVLKRLHKLENAGIMEKKMDEERKFFWMVIYIPDKPKAPILWRESKSLSELEEERIANDSNIL